ncbi:MAG TPA: RsmD family RNA methyltransferase, partial [Sphingomonas sp.]
ALRTNIAKLGAKADIRAQSVLALGPARAPLDLVMMDPPYGTGAGAVALDKLARLGWVGPASWVSIETARDEKVEVAGFEVDAEKIYGKARVTLLRQI